MLKILIGFIFAIIFIVIIIYLIHSLQAEAKKKAHKKAEAEIEALPVLASLKDSLSYLQSIRKNPTYERIGSMLDFLIDRLTRILAIIEKHPDYSNPIRELELHILPLMRKLLCNYETYMTANVSQGKNTRDGLDIINEGLEKILSALDQCIDAALQGNTIDLSAEVSVLQKLYK